MRAFVTLLASIPLGVATFLAPLVCFCWLLFTGSWSPMLFIFLFGLLALSGLMFILFTSGFLGLPGIMGMPILFSAYVQLEFFTDYRAKFGDAYSIPFMLASMALASIPTALLLSNGSVSSYWQVLGIHAAALPVGFLIGYFVERGN